MRSWIAAICVTTVLMGCSSSIPEPKELSPEDEKKAAERLESARKAEGAAHPTEKIDAPNR